MSDVPITKFQWSEFPNLIFESADSGYVLYLITTAIIIGVWRLFLYYREDRFFPKIEFFCDILFKAEQNDLWIVEVVCVVRNKGTSGHKARDLEFRIHGLEKSDLIKFGDSSINEQLEFPHLIKEGRWKARPTMNERIEANTSQFYRHVTIIPKDFQAVAIHGSMRYKQRRFGFIGRRVRHTANRLIRIPESLEEAEQCQNSDRLKMEYADRSN